MRNGNSRKPTRLARLVRNAGASSLGARLLKRKRACPCALGKAQRCPRRPSILRHTQTCVALVARGRKHPWATSSPNAAARRSPQSLVAERLAPESFATAAHIRRIHNRAPTTSLAIATKVTRGTNAAPLTPPKLWRCQERGSNAANCGKLRRQLRQHVRQNCGENAAQMWQNVASMWQNCGESVAKCGKMCGERVAKVAGLLAPSVRILVCKLARDLGVLGHPQHMRLGR